MRVFTRRFLSSCSLALGLAAVTAASAGTHAPSAIVGHSYVDGNSLIANTIVGLDRHADGTLTPIPGSPFGAGGAGLGQGLGSQGAIQLSSDGRYLLAVDAGSNQISVLRLGAHGVPVPVGAPVSSGGIEPVSIAVHDDLVYVANTGAGGSNYTGFRLDHAGRLDPLSNSTVTVPDGSGLGDVLFSSTGTRLAGTRAATSLIDSFTVLPDGRLRAGADSPYPGQGVGQIGAEFSPRRPSQLFVSNAHNGAGLGTVSALRVSRAGFISPIGTSPFADLQTAPCWVEISHDGKYLYAVNTGSGNISSYSIDRHGQLTLIASFPFNNGTGAIDARLAPDGRTLSVVGGRSDVVSYFAVNGGSLTEYSTSPTALPAGLTPSGIVVT